MINSWWDVKIEYHGTEQQPVIIIDNFASDPEGLKKAASSQQFGIMGPYYPGIRSAVAPDSVIEFTKNLASLVADVFGASQFDIVESLYSLVTTPAERLMPIQRLPHFDGLDPRRLALLHYLGTPEQGGTAFYRHRSTGYETVTADRFEHFSKTLEADVQRDGLPIARYISGDTPLYDQIALHEAKFNRAILYRGITLHCAHIDAGTTLTADPLRGRLTVNTFLELT